MSNQIATYLATETVVELKHHREFGGRISNAAEFVLFKAVRDDRVFVPRREDLTKILKALVALVRGRNKTKGHHERQNLKATPCAQG